MWNIFRRFLLYNGEGCTPSRGRSRLASTTVTSAQAECFALCMLFCCPPPLPSSLGYSIRVRFWCCFRTQTLNKTGGRSQRGRGGGRNKKKTKKTSKYRARRAQYSPLAYQIKRGSSAGKAEQLCACEMLLINCNFGHVAKSKSKKEILRFGESAYSSPGRCSSVKPVFHHQKRHSDRVAPLDFFHCL